MENKSFRTVIKTTSEKNKIDYASNIVLFGSCFSENIGNKLRYFKFHELTNPYGILFNPIAIETAINECVNNKRYTKDDLFFHHEQWHSFQHHSDFSDTNSEIVLENINTQIAHTHKELKKATHLIITLGTAWIYEHLEKNKIVANCHKVPQKKFLKKLTPIDGIKESLENIKMNLQRINPLITVIFTISPVRHLKDGMIENSLSKAHLLSAVHQVSDSKTFYFPSNEIMLDDLRDYRFYKSDMVHPNETAIDYIWKVFKETWISNQTEKLQKEIVIIQKGLSHKPFNTNSLAHKSFEDNLRLKIKNLKEKYNIIFNK